MPAANRFNAWVLCFLGGFLATGCSVLDANKSLFSTAASAPAVEKNGPTAMVEYRTANGDTKSVTVPVAGDEFHVQQLMDKANAWRKFSRVEVELRRQTPQGRQTKMAVSYDRGKKRVDPQCDYQVQAGDVLVVTEDPSNVIDDMMGAVNPFKKKSPAKGTIRG